MAGSPPASTLHKCADAGFLLPPASSLSAALCVDPLLLEDYIGSYHGFLDPNAAAPTHHLSATPPQRCYGSASNIASQPSCTMLSESPSCTLLPQVCERLPSLTGFVAPPPHPSKLVHLLCSPEDMSTQAADVAAGTTLLPPTGPLLSSNNLGSLPAFIFEFNGDTVYKCAPLRRLESFTFPLYADLWQGLDAEFIKQAMFQEASASNMLPESVLDVSNNQNALAHVVDQVSQLDSMVADDYVSRQHLSQSKLPELQSAILCPTIDMQGTIYTDAISEPMPPIVTSPPSFLHQTPNGHLEAWILPTSCHGTTVEEDPQETFHEVEDMSFGHGGNQAAREPNKTEFYRRIDRLAWKKHGQAGGIKKKKKPRSKSFSVTNHGGAFEGMDPIYDGNKVKFRLKTLNVNLDDGFSWFKYGQRIIINEKHPRNYLKCVESTRIRCKALKRIQRCSQDEDYVEFLYLGRHNHSP